MKTAYFLFFLGAYFFVAPVALAISEGELSAGVFFGSLLIAGVPIYFGVRRLRSQKARRRAEIPRTISSSTSHTATIKITVPPSTSWQPSQAVGFVSAIVRLGEPVRLLIVATSREIGWHVELPEPIRDMATRTILSFYPQADIQVVPQEPPTSSSDNRMELKAGLEFYAPLPYADELKSLDPLVGIVGAMANLRDGENVIYQVHITPSQKNYNEEGQKKLHKSAWPMVINSLMAATDNRRVHVHTAPPSLDRFETRYQRLFEDKVNATLTPVEVSVQVKAASHQRFQTLLSSVLTASGVFERENGNFLIISGSGGHDLVLSPPEIAALWHLPTEQIQTQGVVRTSGATAPLPVELMQPSGDMLLGNNTYQGQPRPVFLADPDRITHMNIVGKTRVGKTTLMHNLIHQDIARGHGVGVIDPHGDLVRDILESSIPPEREQDVVLFDLADTDHPLPLNLLYVPSGVARHSAVGLTLGVMKKIFADQWSATRMEDALYSALVHIGGNGHTISDRHKRAW